MNLCGSVSGGETSAFMAQWIGANMADRYDNVLNIFANTGQENAETLDFLDACDKAFNLNLIWVEAVTHPGKRIGCTHKIVTRETASLDGAPFEAMIQKYGIPNNAYPHCTRELKLNPINSYLRSIGWKAGSYDTAIGIRTDEMDRVSAKAKEKRLIYPLAFEYPMTKPAINEWWSKQPFRLKLKGYQGNCKWCWKKSDRKLFTLAKESPELFDFPHRMETQYGKTGSEVPAMPASYTRQFFRSNRTATDILRAAKNLPASFVQAEDDSYLFDSQLDIQFDCADTCEATL